MAVCVPGHAHELDAIAQRESLLAVRRQVNLDNRLSTMVDTLRDYAQTLLRGGPVGRLVQTLH